MTAFLTMTEGHQAGARFSLDPSGENRIGRGLECHVVLVDPLCSRIHAVVFQESGEWWLRDAESRNGTFLNEQKIDEARLVEGCSLRVGKSSFTFHETGGGDAAGGHVTQTIVLDTPMEGADAGEFVLSVFQDAERMQDLLLMHQLSIKLLGCNHPDEIIRSSLELLQRRSDASLVGFLLATDEGDLRPKMVIPEELEGRAVLSRSLTEIVSQQRRAVWVDNQSALQAGGDGTESLSHFADAICAPLIHKKHVLGALHIYNEHGRFQESIYHLSIAVANILVTALARARELINLQAAHNYLVAKSAASDEMIGESKPMQNLKSKISRIARAQGCALIRGESGSGKELVARALHRASSRADRPMLSVNCAVIPPHLMESHLFGHKKGAFTGADEDREGWFQQADTGTLFLDELGEMTLDGQAKLLRVLEGHPFLPVGGTKEVQVDVRVIAATNRDLAEFVREGKFREDLYYRLSVFELYIPPLRERGADIELLVDFFLDHFRKQNGRPNLQLSDEARQKMLGYHWPGNVRQLRNVIDSATVMAEGDFIEPDDLGLRDAGVKKDQDTFDNLRLAYWEKKLIEKALDRTSGNVPEACKLLDIPRATLYRRIKDYNIKR